MSIETEIQTEVDALKARFSDTKELYREVCALLFFRHGIIPTTNKLYQFVRKGSMSAPADALNNFWDELRSKARVEIDQPDLPEEIKETAAAAIAALWRQASAAAREELRTLREEAAAGLASSQDDLQAARERYAVLEGTIDTLREELNRASAATDATRVELESERRAHAASAARIQELQRQIADLQAAQEAARTTFSAELDKARAAVNEAVERAAATERRALLEVDDERQARKRSDQQLEQLRSASAQAEATAQARALVDAEEAGRMRAELESLKQANRGLSESSDSLQGQFRTLQTELDETRQDRTRYRVEAETAMAMVERLSTGTPAKAAATRSGKAKKDAQP